MLISVEHNWESYVALRLQPVLQALCQQSKEPELRAKLKLLYGKSYRGLQYFLNAESNSLVPTRSQHHNNTKSCKCIFIAHRDIREDTLEKLSSGT